MSISYLTADGHRLEYRLIGPTAPAADAPVLVFLHEGLGSVALWKNFPEEVARETGCSALVYSRYGYGKSDPLTRPRAPDYMHREAQVVLPEVLRQLEIVDPVIVGHSDGASIALIYAARGKQAVRGLILLAPHVFVEDLTVRSIAQAKVAYETTDLPVKLGRYHDDVDSTFRGWNDIWLHPDFRNWNIEAYLPGVRAPILLIQGMEDQYGSLAQVEAIQRQADAPVRTLVLERCAHSPHVDQTQTTLEAISEFVQGLMPRPLVATPPA
jgi:pimeloyl-ACP methyl ester carboxylesterase